MNNRKNISVSETSHEFLKDIKKAYNLDNLDEAVKYLVFTYNWNRATGYSVMLREADSETQALNMLNGLHARQTHHLFHDCDREHNGTWDTLENDLNILEIPSYTGLEESMRNSIRNEGGEERPQLITEPEEVKSKMKKVVINHAKNWQEIGEKIRGGNNE